MTKRRNLIQRVCNTSDHALSNIIKEEDFFDAKEPLDASWMFAIKTRNIVWCPVYKVHTLSASYPLFWTLPGLHQQLDEEVPAVRLTGHWPQHGEPTGHDAARLQQPAGRHAQAGATTLRLHCGQTSLRSAPGHLQGEAWDSYRYSTYTSFILILF